MQLIGLFDISSDIGDIFYMGVRVFVYVQSDLCVDYNCAMLEYEGCIC